MADSEKIAFEVDVKGSEQTIESMKDLKAAIKAAKDEQLKAASVYGESSKEFIEASKNVSKLKDKVEDLNDSTKSLKGSGVEKVTESFSQLGEGLRNLDTDKIKTGFRGIGAAMSAIPIFLLIEGLKYLVENFDEVSAAVKKFFNVTSDAEKNIQKLEKAANDLKETNSLLVSSLENEVKILEASGASQGKILELKKQIIAQKIKEYELDIQIQKAKIQEIYANDSLTESYFKLAAATARKFGDERQAQILERVAAKEKAERAKENIDKLRSDLILIQNLKTEEIVTTIKTNKAIADSNKKLQEDKQKAELDAWNKSVEIRIANKAAQDADDKRLAEEKKAQDEIDRQASLDYMNSVGNDEKAITDTTYDYKKAKRDQELEEFKQNTEAQLNATKQGLQAAQSITDIFFNYKLGKVKGDAKAENEIRKKQFNVNKAFGITNAVIDGIGAVQKALNNPYPLNIVLAAISGAAAIANVAKIASTKFEPSGGDTGGGGGGAVAVPIPTPPTINTPNANTNSSTSFDETGKKVGEAEKIGQPTINVKATVGVDEITDKSNRVQVLEKQSTF